VESIVRPPYSVIVVGAGGGQVPPATEGLVTHDASSMAIGTMSSADGATRIRLLDAPIAELDGPADADVDLETDGRIVVSSVEGDVYLACSVAAKHVRIRVWCNDPIEPDQITIVVGGTIEVREASAVETS
jgi:hypothetical protein